jgi:hypothetical protein
VVISESIKVEGMRQQRERDAYHPWPSRLSRKFLCHETIDEGTVNHQANKEAGTLHTDCSKCDCDGVNSCSRGGVRKGINEICCDRSHKEERVCGENPDGCHCMDGEGSVIASASLKKSYVRGV